MNFYQKHFSRKINIYTVLTAAIMSVLLLLISGCATTEQYHKNLATWHGKNINQFVSAWGYPDRTMKTPNGNTVYVYVSKQTTNFPQYQTGGYTSTKVDGSTTTITQVPSVSTGGGTYYYKCTTWVEFDKTNKIVNTSFRGNSCVSNKP